MRAIAAFPSEKKLSLVDRPSPRIERDTDVRLRMLEIGICGTDREIARFEYGRPPANEPYLVMGHESLAQVAEVGKAVSQVKVGDLVVPTVRRPCGTPECLPCRFGRQDFCRTGKYTERGINNRHSFMTKEVIEDESNLHLVPHSIADIAVLTEPLTIAEKGIIEVGHILARLPWLATLADHGRSLLPKRRGLVLGAGPVGLLGALALAVRGLDTWVYSRESATSDKAAWVEGIGAHYLSSQDVPADALAERLGFLDLIYEATGSAVLPFVAMRSLSTSGIFIFTGVPGHKEALTIDTQRLMRDLVLKNQVLYGTVNAGPDAFDAAIADLVQFKARWPDQVKQLLTARFAPESFEVPLTGPQTGIKNVIRFAEAERS